MGKHSHSAPENIATEFGIGRLKRHVLLCAGPDCVDTDSGEETWSYLKKRL